jgi:phosphopantetheine adenylyltransferase
VRTIVSGQEDFEVVGEIRDEAGILSGIEETDADCLIVAQEKFGRRPAICESVLRKSPHLRILAVASGSEESTLYWASTAIRSSRIETSEEGVLKALRSTVGSS